MSRRLQKRHRHSKGLIIFLLICAVFIGYCFFWWQNGIAPVNPSDTIKRLVVVSQGEGVHAIAAQLSAKGLIKDPLVFSLLVKQMGLDNRIQAGEFHIAPAMSARQIVTLLQRGSFDIVVTIPEGKRAEEIADILQAKLPDYQETWRHALDNHEGYLFPDTYSFDDNTTINQIIQRMTDNFAQKYGSIPDGKKMFLSKSQIVTIASIVEREAKFPQDRPLVASVILNRLQAHMPLQIDATVQYALGYQPQEQTWWKQDLTAEDLHYVSFYNTYLNTGLPPTPISNPGLESLKAVIEAPQTDYLYYVSDKSGHNHYEVTAAEHDADAQKYGL